MTATTEIEGDAPFLDVTAPDFHFSSPAADAAREAGAYARTPIGLAVLRYDEIRAIMHDQRFAQNGEHLLGLAGVTEGPVWDFFVPVILYLNGADHRRQRQAVGRALGPRHAEALRPYVQERARTLAEGLAAAGGDAVDVVGGFADPLALSVLHRALGVPLEIERFARLISELGLYFGLPGHPEHYPVVERAVLEFDGFLAGQLDEALAAPPRDGDDLFSQLLAAHREGQLSATETRHLAMAMVIAGSGTSRYGLGRMFDLFGRHPDQWQRLAEHPELAPLAAEEVLRKVPPAPAVYRFATEDVQLDDVRVPAGTFVMLCAETAHRDPQKFENAETFDVGREGAAPLSFGAGAHYCLGAPLSRVELAESMIALTARLGPPSAAGAGTWNAPLGVHGPDALPMRFAPR